MSEKSYFTAGPVSPDFIAQQIEKHNSKKQIGAHSIFLGQVRADEKNGKKVAAIEYTAYPEMANKEISAIREDAFSRWPLSCLHIYHSTGLIKSGEISLFVFVSAAHRKEAIDAMEYIVEELKHKVPIWKKEIMEDASEYWVQE